MSWNNEDEVNQEDILSMVTIDVHRKVKVTAELRNEQNEVIPLKKVVEDLLDYVATKLQDTSEGNTFISQIYPLMAQTLGAGLPKICGPQMAGFHMSNEVTRISFTQIMSVSFMLLKYVQQNKLTIHTIEEPMDEAEIFSIKRKSKITSILSVSAQLGIEPREIIKKLVAKGDMSIEEAEDLFGEPFTEGETEDDNDGTSD